MKKTTTALLVFTCIVLSAAAQSSLSEETASMLRERSDEFMSYIFDGDYAAAFDFIRSVPTAISDSNIDSLESSASEQLEAVGQHYGDKIGYSYISTDTVSDFLARYRYAVRYEHHLIWWQIVYYRGMQEGEEAWFIDNISYDDDIQALLDSN